MSLVERARERVEEIRTKGPATVLEEKFPKLREIRGGGSSSSPQLPTLRDIREKGILGVVKEKFPSGGSSSSPQLPTLRDIKEKGILGVVAEKFPKVKEIRETGIIGLLKGSPKGTSPPGRSPPILEEKELRVRGAHVVL